MARAPSRPPRYAPGLPLPARRFLPGGPVPRPRGLPVPPVRMPAQPWSSPERLPPPAVMAFRYGVDLYNADCCWEAHEAWEELWAHAARPSALRDLLQGLILLAAARVQHACGRPRGSVQLSRRALARLRTADARGAGPRPLGLPLAALQRTLSRRLDAQPERPLARRLPLRLRVVAANGEQAHTR